MLQMRAARPAYENGGWYNQGLTWQANEVENLRTLCNADADPERAAAALGRQAKTLAYRAREEGLIIPKSWRRLLPASKRLIRAHHPIAFSYPYIINARPEHATNTLYFIKKFYRENFEDGGRAVSFDN